MTKRLKKMDWRVASDEELELFWDVFLELLLRGLDMINDVFGKFMHYVQEFFKAAGANGWRKTWTTTQVALLLLQTHFDVEAH